VDITSRLNQFAHSMDEPVARVVLAELLERVVLLMRRLARRQGIDLTAAAPDRDLSLLSDPFRLQLVLATVIEHLLETLEPGGGIVLHGEGSPPEVKVLLAVQGTKKPEWAGLAARLSATLKEVLETLPARLAVSIPPAQEGVMVTIAAADSTKD
jgi:signal transduction histidine kinase